MNTLAVPARLFLWAAILFLQPQCLRAETSDFSLNEFIYELIPSYGNYCGPNMTYGGPDSILCPLPIDGTDAVCALHDYHYAHTTDADAFSRALADLKLSGGFLTSQSDSLEGFLYSTAGSFVMPMQAAYWTVKGGKKETGQWLVATQAKIDAYRKAQADAQKASLKAQSRYYREIMIIGYEHYARKIREAMEVEKINIHEQTRYWDGYYSRLLKESAARYKNTYKNN